MKTAEVVVKNRVGLHSRPLNYFVETANHFKCAIWLEMSNDSNRHVNAKSMLGVLSLGILADSKVKIIADGSDEDAAVKALEALINSEFKEPELYEVLRTVPSPFN